MTPYQQFKQECQEEIAIQGADPELKHASQAWMDLVNRKKYSYHFEWLGRPIIQYPQDIVAMQELIWEVKPDLIIETGIAHGGSLIFYASMLELLVQCGVIENGEVLGVDIEIRPHNHQAILEHPMSKRITMLQGSSIDPAIVAQIKEKAKGKQRVMVTLDSNHTHDHVFAELQHYAELVSVGSYCVVFDTVIEDMPDDMFGNRPWSKGNNPKTAVELFMQQNRQFEIDERVTNKLLVSVAPKGFLKRIA